MEQFYTFPGTTVCADSLDEACENYIGSVAARIVVSDKVPEINANERLFAAAPELLDAAKALLANWENGNLSPYIQRLSREIAKAEGRA